MELRERIGLYKEIEKARGRPLVVYATSTRPNFEGRMAGDVVREFVDQLNAISDATKIDIMIHSTGGDALTAWK